MKNKKITITIIASVALVLTFILLTSYAYWRVSQTQTGTNNINGACLSIRLEQYYDEDDNLIEGFTLENAWPITDQEGSAQEGYSFKVVNECEEDLTYQVILDSLPVSGERINPSFVKVELDDRAIRRYDSLEDAPKTDEYSTIGNKKVYTGTILGNGEVEHTIKFWISEDSTNDDIGKAFSSKIRVMAGQQIVPSSGLTLKILSETGEPDATINNLHVGDRVGYGTEQFYVIGINGNNIKLLSRYLINVGDHPNPSGTYGLQYAELGFTNMTVYTDSSSEEYYYGSVPFSDNVYWWDTSNGIWISPYMQNSFVYNDQASISAYVDRYADVLSEMGLNVVDGTLLSLEDVTNLCSTSPRIGYLITNECPKYLRETTYWLGNAVEWEKLWTIYAHGYANYGYYNYDDGNDISQFGVRPVITISLS